MIKNHLTGYFSVIMRESSGKKPEGTFESLSNDMFFLSFFLPWLVLQSVNFVTASDDNTCAIWDLRNTKERLRTLEGHTGWVKNCEVFGTNLVTFALDATLRNWDISEFTPAREVCAELLMAGVGISDV